MIKKIKRISIAFLFLLLVLSSVMVFKTTKGNAESYIYYADSFETELMTVTPNVSKFGNKGLGLSSKYKAATAKTINKACGNFETEFSFISDNDNAYLKEFEIEFKDANEKGFSVIVENLLSEINVSVSVSGERYGLSYVGEDLESKTSQNNKIGVYTKLNSADAYKIIYEKESGNVFVKANGVERLVWCINSLENDGAKGRICLFDSVYDAKFKFNDIVYPQAKYGKNSVGIIVYSVNGQTYDGTMIVNRKGPDVYAFVSDKAIAGEKYFIPKPVAFDIIDGKINGIYVEVKNTFGTVLSKTVYSDGLSFIAEAGNVYNIKYSAADTDGLEGIFERLVDTVSDKSESKIIYSNSFSSADLGVGSNVYIPEAYAVSNTFITGTDRNVSLEIKFENTVKNKYLSVSDISDRNFIFDSIGQYAFEFVCENENHRISEVFVFNITADNVVILSDGELLSEYDADSDIVFPDMWFKRGENTVKADKCVTYPDGCKYSVTGNVALETEGWYKIEYKAKINGETFVKESTFKVRKPFLDFYGGISHYTSIINGDEKSVVSFSNADQKIVTNGVVDLNEFSAHESFVEIEFMPLEEDALDFSWIYVTLTDVEDPSVYVLIRLATTADGEASKKVYAGARTDSADYFTGVLRDFGKETEYISHNMWGARSLVDPGKTGQILKLSYDLTSNIVYINYTSESEPNLPVVDLDSLRYVDEMWDGFPSGKVTVSISVDKIVASKARFSINKLGKGGTADDGYCDIRIQTEYDEYPQAKAGESFRLFDAYAVNGKGMNLPVDVSVVFANNQNIQIATDGKYFIPPAEGVYYVVYSAKAFNGDTYIKKMTVNAVKALPDIEIDAEFNETVYAGERFEIPAYTVNGATGKAEVKTYIEFNGEKQAIEKTYLPLNEGEYSIVYEVTDYIGRKAEKRIAFNCVGKEIPVFIEPEFKIDYMLCGQEYVLPELWAYDSGYKEIIKASVSVINDGVVTDLADNKFKPDYTASADITVRYSAKGKNATGTVDYSVKAINIKDGRRYIAKNLFVGKDVSILPQTDGITLYTENDGKVRFVNPVIKNFNISFALGNVGFEKFNIYLTDYADETNVLKIGCENNGGKLIVRINGTERVYYGVGSAFAAGNLIDVVYNDEQKVFTNNAKEFQHKVKFNLNGEDFNGFKSNSVYVDLEFEGVNAASSVTVVYINNQSFRNQISDGKITDMFKPQVLLLSDYGGKYAYGEEFTTQKAAAFDVLSGETDCVVSCVSPSGEYVTTIDGFRLQNLPASVEYKFKFTEYGSYTIEFYAADANGKEEYFTYSIKIQDREPPQIELTEQVNVNVRAGNKIKVAGVTVKDNVSPASALMIFVTFTDTKGIVRLVNVGDEITVSEAGKCAITYLVYDEAVNVGIKTIEITVE